MSTIVLPDEVIAVKALLQGAATQAHEVVSECITALHLLASPDYIGTKFRDAWGTPGRGVTHNCIIVGGAGGFGPERDLPISQGRVTIKCYSAQPHVATQMGALVQRILMPVDRRHSGWTAANTRVIGVLDLTKAVLLVEPDTDYQYTTQTGSVRFFERAATA